MRKSTRAIRGVEVAPLARGLGLATRLCTAVTTLVLLGLCSSAQALEVPSLTGATGPTGPAGERGPTGPTGPAGTGGTGSSGALPEFLPSGAKESGVWSASIDLVAGATQQQVDGTVGYAIQLKEKPTVIYRNEKQVEIPEPPCTGNANEPEPEAGFLCVYRSGNFGSLESQDTNAAFAGFQDAAGNNYGSGPEGGKAGELIIFRTITFNTEAKTAAEERTLGAAAHLTASGSWAVVAK